MPEGARAPGAGVQGRVSGMPSEFERDQGRETRVQ